MYATFIRKTAGHHSAELQLAKLPLRKLQAVIKELRGVAVAMGQLVDLALVDFHSWGISRACEERRETAERSEGEEDDEEEEAAAASQSSAWEASWEVSWARLGAAIGSYNEAMN